MLIKQSSSSRVIPFFLVDSADHIAGKTGVSPTVTISKNGAAFASPSGAVSEIGSGWYKIAGNATDSNTLGALLIHATATGADPFDVIHEVVAHDIDSSTVLLSSGTGVGQISLSGGLVTLAGVTHTGAVIPTVTNLTNAPTSGDLTATMKASVQTELATYGALKPTVAARTLDVTATGEAGIDWANIGSPTSSQNLSGTSIATAANVTTVNGLAANVITAASIAVDAIGASELAADAIAEIVDAVWDEVLSGHLIAGTTGAALNGAGSAGDPWTTILPGAYGAGTAGKILGDNLNATVSSRASQTSADAIKAKTDNLPAAPAATGDIPTATQNADALLKRDMSAVTGEASRSPLNSLRFLRNKWSLSGTTLTVTKEDDSTSAWTSTVSTDASAEPIVGSDPVG